MSHVLRRKLYVKDITLDYRNRSIVVSVEVSISYGKADGTITRTENTPSQQVLPLGKYTEDDIPALTEDLLNNCKLIHPSKKPLIEQLLKDLLNPSQTASALQSPPTVKFLPMYLEALYESPANKLKATEKLIAVLSNTNESTVLAVVQNEALLGALARVARETQISDPTLTGNIIEIFSLIKSHSGLSIVLKDFRIIELCMRLLRSVIENISGKKQDTDVVLDSDGIRSAIRGTKSTRDRRDRSRMSGTSSPSIYQMNNNNNNGIGLRQPEKILSYNSLEMLTKIFQLLSSIGSNETDFINILKRYHATETMRDIIQILYVLGRSEAFSSKFILKRMTGSASNSGSEKYNFLIFKAMTFAVYFLFKTSADVEDRKGMNPSGVVFEIVNPQSMGNERNAGYALNSSLFSNHITPSDPPTSVVFVLVKILGDLFGTSGEIFTTKDVAAASQITPFTSCLPPLYQDPVVNIDPKSSFGSSISYPTNVQSLNDMERMSDVVQILQQYKENTPGRKNTKNKNDDEIAEMLNLFILLTVNILKLLFNLSIDSDRENIHLSMYQLYGVLHRIVQILSIPSTGQDLLSSTSVQQICLCLLTELVKIIYNASVDYITDLRVQRLKDVIFQRGLINFGIQDTILATARGSGINGSKMSLESLVDVQGLSSLLKYMGSPMNVRINPQQMDPTSLRKMQMLDAISNTTNSNNNNNSSSIGKSLKRNKNMHFNFTSDINNGIGDEDFNSMDDFDMRGGGGSDRIRNGNAGNSEEIRLKSIKKMYSEFFSESDVFLTSLSSSSDPVAFVNLNRTFFALKKEFLGYEESFYDDMFNDPDLPKYIVSSSVSDYDLEDIVRTKLQLFPSTTAFVALDLFRFLNAIMSAKLEKPSCYNCFDQNTVISLCAVLINLLKDPKTKLFTIAASTKTSTSSNGNNKDGPITTKKILVYSQLIHQLTSYALNPNVISSPEWQGINGLFVKLLTSVADYCGYKYIFDSGNQDDKMMNMYGTGTGTGTNNSSRNVDTGENNRSSRTVVQKGDNQYIFKVTIGDYFIHYVKKVISLITPSIPSTFGYIKILGMIIRSIEYSEDFNGPQHGDDTLRVNINNTKYTLGAIETSGTIKSLFAITEKILNNNSSIIAELRTMNRFRNGPDNLSNDAGQQDDDLRGITRLDIQAINSRDSDVESAYLVDSDVLLDIVVVVVSYLRLIVAYNIIMGKKKEKIPERSYLDILSKLLHVLIIINNSVISSVNNYSKEPIQMKIIEPELLCYVIYGLYQYFTLHCESPDRTLASQIVHELLLAQELCNNYQKTLKDLSGIVTRTLGLIDERISDEYKRDSPDGGKKNGPSMSHFNAYNYMFVQKLKESGLM